MTAGAACRPAWRPAEWGRGGIDPRRRIGAIDAWTSRRQKRRGAARIAGDPRRQDPRERHITMTSQPGPDYARLFRTGVPDPAPRWAGFPSTISSAATTTAA